MSLSLCVCIFSAFPTSANSQAANDPILRDEMVDRTGDGVVADVLNGVEAIAKDSGRALEAEAKRDASKVESALDSRRTPTPNPDSDESIDRDIEKLEALSQE